MNFDGPPESQRECRSCPDLDISAAILLGKNGCGCCDMDVDSKSQTIGPSRPFRGDLKYV